MLRHFFFIFPIFSSFLWIYHTFSDNYRFPDRASLSYMARESSRRCKVDFIAELPFPVVHHLLGFLPLETLAIMKRVGRAWYNIMPPVWLTGCARLGVPVYEGGCTVDIGLLYVMGIL